jgi:hypothetical protein
VNPSDWYDAFTGRVSDTVEAVRRQAALVVEDLRLRTEMADLVETDRILRAKRGCRR